MHSSKNYNKVFIVLKYYDGNYDVFTQRHYVFIFYKKIIIIKNILCAINTIKIQRKNEIFLNTSFI